MSLTETYYDTFSVITSVISYELFTVGITQREFIDYINILFIEIRNRCPKCPLYHIALIGASRIESEINKFLDKMTE